MIKTKIICTIGPASSTASVLRNMISAGMDVARFNFSHASHREHFRRLQIIRELNKKSRRRIKILADLEGYRIRIGTLPEPVSVKKRQIVFLSNKEHAGGGRIIPFDYEGPLTDIKPASHIYIDDGNIALQVKSCTEELVSAETIIPGIILENKGINIPDVNLSFKGLTEKDKQDLRFAVKYQFDYVAQSFVRNRQDIICLKDFLKGSGLKCGIIAKIENRQGIAHIDGIMDVCDGIMIARGDMGVSMPIYEIPVIQKEIIRACNQRKKFVITATQMLESMTEHSRPTRAEVTDVANAVLDGSDFLMLSAETAVGKYPVETVRLMKRIAGFTERYMKRKKEAR